MKTVIVTIEYDQLCAGLRRKLINYRVINQKKYTCEMSNNLVS